MKLPTPHGIDDGAAREVHWKDLRKGGPSISTTTIVSASPVLFDETRLAVAGFVGGGLAQLHALSLASYDVLGQTVKATKFQIATQSLRLLRTWSKR